MEEVQEGLRIEEDYAHVLAMLPDGWREKAKELGALRRCRKVQDPERLLRVLLIHLAEGCSLRETSLRARQGGILQISDVAIMDRLRSAQQWFWWINQQLMRRWVRRGPEVVFPSRWRVRLIDGTRIKEPGPTGSSWLIHYSIGLPGLSCDELLLSAPKGGEGESFRHFAVHPGDLFIGDRVYGVRPGLLHVVSQGADVLTRFVLSNLPLESLNGAPFDLLWHLRRLKARQMGDWPVQTRDDGQGMISGRVVAVAKTRQAAERAQQDVRRQAQKHGGATVKPETLEAAKYIFVFTTARREDLSASHALEMYRGRWQIELVFKRLKSILGLGHLRKTDPESAKAWLQGKLLVAFLIEALIRCGESFFPWGWPLDNTPSLPLARRAIYAAPSSPDIDADHLTSPNPGELA